jgi:hypothetical protein
MAYTAIDDAGSYFNPKLYTGTGASNAQTGVGFQPDFTWIKNRDAADFHVLTDAVRGVTDYLVSDDTDAETTNAESLTGFDSDGFTVGDMNEVNTNTEAFVAWNWKANGAGSANTDGSISTTATSANTTAGFSISTYTGTGSAATIGHGLNSEAKMIIIKDRGTVADWFCYHSALGNGTTIKLNTTDASYSSINWNSTTPTSSVFSLRAGGDVNTSAKNYIAYCFAEKQGYSKFSSYTGNGNADGPFVYTGFKPAWIMMKDSNSASAGWMMFDNKRLGYNVDNNALYPNATAAEGTGDNVDLLSNGFKARSTDAGINTSGNSYIYMAFAESPLVNSEGVPTNAR